MNLSSNIRRTTSRTKETFKDRDFFINFMNEDSMPILPKNMHLLTDDDTNQNIDNKTKFQKLADLLLEDKETVIENFFLKKVEDKMILKLYTALSRRSIDVFMEEKSDSKDKNRILLHKLNNIKLPKFILKEKNNNFEEDEKEILDENNKDLDESENSIILKEMINKSPRNNSSSQNVQVQSNNISNNNNNININKSNRISISKSQNYENDIFFKPKPSFLPNCKYNKKNNKYKYKIIHLPSLESLASLKSNSLKTRNIYNAHQQKNQKWEPDIDGDLLSYINHNIVKIEDIYNKGKENIFELKENLDEEVKPIEAKEVFFDLNQTENNNDENTENENGDSKNKTLINHSQSKKSLSNLDDEEETDLKNQNKFCEYKDRFPKIIEISYLVEPDKIMMSEFQKDLRELYANRINEVGDLEEIMFPAFGKDLKTKKIYKYALNNERNEEVTTDSFTILGGSNNLSKSIESKKSEEEKLESNLDSNNNSLKEIENSKNNFSEEDSINIKENSLQKEEMNDLKKNLKRGIKNNEMKSNFLYEDTNNLFSIGDYNKLKENLLNTNKDNNKNDIIYDNIKTENDNKNEIKENENNEIKENDNNNNDDEHILKLSFSKISNK